MLDPEISQAFETAWVGRARTRGEVDGECLVV
jgi:hypothetical protein